MRRGTASAPRTFRLLAVNPYGAGAGYNGPSIYLARLLGFAAGTGSWQITVMHGKRGEGRAEYVHRSVTPVHLKRFSAAEQVAWFLLCFFYVLTMGGRHDIIHLHSAYLFNLGAGLAARIRKIPYTILPTSEGGDLRGGATGGPVAERVRRFVVSGASLGFALSSGIAAEMVERGQRPSRVTALPTVVDTNIYRPPGRSGDADPRLGARTAIFLGVLGERKQPHLLLEALAQLPSDEGRAVFVGPFDSPEYEATFMEHLDSLRLRDRVELRGFVRSPENVLTVEGDVLVLVSRQEGLPSAIVEAMASGLPIICSDVGSMGDVVRASGAGILVSSSQELAEALRLVWNDPELWGRLARGGRDFAEENFALGVVGREFADQLQAVVNRKRTA